ncbi:MAG: F0F1 ATP synthase subunit B [Bacteroidetes bacterium]|jgi:F-type H+-transporting ATPase subunit b|nr:F0F1 ATP synthase subunit B [Bacteroidota bacterium]MBK8673694.1 F0F1 ATP synthase subunit B [Bacteroidota bacterium]MBP7255780.1 F0F1 ATP synthase subunit B [Chitinophagales bacterium]
MFYLFNAMDLITPDFGLVFWTTLIFLLFWFIAGKFAFKPISEAIKKRGDSINEALNAALKAKEEIKLMQSDNESLLKQAREERASILKEAKEAKDSIIAEASVRAGKLKDEAMAEIEAQKIAAIADVKQKVGQEVSKLALEIAEKIVGKELSTEKDHQALVKSLVDKIKMN